MFVEDDSAVVSCSDDGTLIYHDLTTGESTAVVRMSDQRLRGFDYHRGAGWLAIGTRQARIRILNVRPAAENTNRPLP